MLQRFKQTYLTKYHLLLVADKYGRILSTCVRILLSAMLQWKN